MTACARTCVWGLTVLPGTVAENPIPSDAMPWMNRTHRLRFPDGAIAQASPLAAAAAGGNVGCGGAAEGPWGAGLRRRLRQRPPAPASDHPRLQRVPDRRGGHGDPPRLGRPDAAGRSGRLPAGAPAAAPARVAADDRYRARLRL